MPHTVAWIRRWAPLAQHLFLQGSHWSPVCVLAVRRPSTGWWEQGEAALPSVPKAAWAPFSFSWKHRPGAQGHTQYSGVGSGPQGRSVIPATFPASTGCLGPWVPMGQKSGGCPGVPPRPCLGPLAVGWGPKRRAGPQEGSHRDEGNVTLQRRAGDGRGGTGTGPSGGWLSDGAFSSTLRARRLRVLSWETGGQGH